jgi:hypothetical protein
MRRSLNGAAGVLLAVVAVGLMTGPPLRAAVIGADTAANSAYNGGWTNGSNGGSGFGPWTLTPQPNGNNAGFFIGSSANNGDGGANAPPPGDIDTSGESWGLYANSGQTSEAVRPLTGTLAVNQFIRLDYDNGWIDNGGSVGFSFLAGGEERLRLTFVGGEQNYTLHDASGPRDTGVGFTDEGMQIDFDPDSPDQYGISISPRGGTSVVLRGDLAGTAGSGIDSIRFFNTNAGPGSQRDVFVNSLLVLPEPAGLGLLIVAAGGLRRRR